MSILRTLINMLAIGQVTAAVLLAGAVIDPHIWLLLTTLLMACAAVLLWLEARDKDRGESP